MDYWPLEAHDGPIVIGGREYMTAIDFNRQCILFDKTKPPHVIAKPIRQAYDKALTTEALLLSVGIDIRTYADLEE